MFSSNRRDVKTKGVGKLVHTLVHSVGKPRNPLGSKASKFVKMGQFFHKFLWIMWIKRWKSLII